MIWHFHASIHVWSPWANRENIEIHHEKVRGVRLVDDVLGLAAIFSWASDSGILRCWDAATGDEQGQFEAPSALEGVDWIPYTPDGPAVLGWAGDRVLLWDARTGDKRFEARHDRKVVGARWIADAGGSPAILSSSYDKTIRLWDLSGNERLCLQSDQSAPVASWIDATLKGPAILSWSIIDRQIILWDPETKQKRFHVHHDEDVTEALWLPDGSRPAILSWAKDRTIRLWDATRNDLVARFDLDSAAVSVKARTASRRDLELAVGCSNGTVGVLSLLDLRT